MAEGGAPLSGDVTANATANGSGVSSTEAPESGNSGDIRGAVSVGVRTCRSSATGIQETCIGVFSTGRGCG